MCLFNQYASPSFSTGKWYPWNIIPVAFSSKIGQAGYKLLNSILLKW